MTVACWDPGQTSPYHCHPNCTEIYFCYEGGGTMRTLTETVPVVAWGLFAATTLANWTSNNQRAGAHIAVPHPLRQRNVRPHQGVAEQSRLEAACRGCRLFQGRLKRRLLMRAVTIEESRVGHIFRDARGHFREDTAANRQILIDVAARPDNFHGTDRFGNDWFADMRADGTQVWVHVRGGKIINGGLNPIPLELDPFQV